MPETLTGRHAPLVPVALEEQRPLLQAAAIAKGQYLKQNCKAQYVKQNCYALEQPVLRGTAITSSQYSIASF